MQYKIEFVRHRDDRDPEIVSYRTIEVEDLVAAEAQAARLLRNTYDAGQFPRGATVTFLIRQDREVVFP